MPIVSLPDSTTRAIGCILVLTDSCSVVKELIDNALDAQATTITVDLSLNALDVIQVKDNGFGITPDDRKFVCKKHCTSKITTIEDVRRLGGTSLGFRGEALSSIADLSGNVKITTRIDGEAVAETLNFTQAGELSGSNKVSHPVGTTVRVLDFLKKVPVRHETALKRSSKILDQVKKLLQRYVFARPTVRFSIKILKGKDTKGDWSYIPGKTTSLLDTAVQVVGRDIAAQCFFTTTESSTVDEQLSQSVDQSHQSELHPTDPRQIQISSLLPRSDADLSKILNVGQYFILDDRPLSTARGTPKEIMKLFKHRIVSAARRAGQTSSLSEPFICLHLKCPRGSYDVNVEPSKDDILFEDPRSVLEEVKKLFSDTYGEVEQSTHSQTVSKGLPSPKTRVDTAFDLLLAPKKIFSALRGPDLPTPTDSTSLSIVTEGQNPGPPKRPWKGYRERRRQVESTKGSDLSDVDESIERRSTSMARLDSWMQQPSRPTNSSSSFQRSRENYHVDSSSSQGRQIEDGSQHPLQPNRRLPVRGTFDDEETVFGSSPVRKSASATHMRLHKPFTSPFKLADSSSQATTLSNTQTLPASPGRRSNLEAPEPSFLAEIPSSADPSAAKCLQTTQPCLNAMMDYEHRKKAILAAQRLSNKGSSLPKVNVREGSVDQGSKPGMNNSPHKNRFRAAVATLNRSSDLYQLEAKGLSCDINELRDSAQILRQADEYVATGKNDFVADGDVGIRVDLWQNKVQELASGLNGDGTMEQA